MSLFMLNLKSQSITLFTLLVHRFFEYIRKQILPNGLTGHVAFDGMGDRIHAEYKVINIKLDQRNNFAQPAEVGLYKYSEVTTKFRINLYEYFGTGTL